MSNGEKVIEIVMFVICVLGLVGLLAMCSPGGSRSHSRDYDPSDQYIWRD